MKLNKKCEGCNYKNLPCLLKYNYKLVSRCPCCNCLIKMVCTKICEERKMLFTTFTTKEKEFLIRKLNII